MATCFYPFVKKDETTGREMAFPCGKCPPCLARRASGWSFRLKKEGDRSETALFVTLTYDTMHVPITKKGFMTFNKDHLVAFFKKLRKVEPLKIRYYLCGEYGSERQRPHYHIILFNASENGVLKAWRDNKGKYFGDVFFGKVEGASIGYVLKYMTKPGKIGYADWDDRLPEFSRMSKCLGDNYITDRAKRWHHSNPSEKLHIVIEGGKKIALPRYYRDKIYTDKTVLEEATSIAHHRSLDQNLQKFNKLVEKYGEDEAYRIIENEKTVAYAKMYANYKKNRNKA